MGNLVKIVVRMDTTKGTGLFGKVDDWYLFKVGVNVIFGYLVCYQNCDKGSTHCQNDKTRFNIVSEDPLSNLIVLFR